MNKIHLKKKRVKKINIIIIISILIFISIIYSLYFINKRYSTVFLDYASVRAKKIATLVINSAVTNEIISKYSAEDLFINKKNEEGEVLSIDFNPIVVNKILSTIINSVEEYLTKLENGDIKSLNIKSLNTNDRIKEGVICEIPFGIVFNNSLLSNLGPKIPVRIEYIGDISSDIETKVTDYGINNALIEIIIHIKVTIKIILPISKEDIVITSSIPIAIKLLQGEIPSYYFGNLNTK